MCRLSAPVEASAALLVEAGETMQTMVLGLPVVEAEAPSAWPPVLVPMSPKRLVERAAAVEAKQAVWSYSTVGSPAESVRHRSRKPTSPSEGVEEGVLTP